MAGIQGLGVAGSLYGAGTEKGKQAGKKTVQTAAKSGEGKLSAKAAKFLENLRKSNSDFDYVVANPGDDYKALAKQSNKEFTVIYSNEEIEKMASDPKYAAEKMQQVNSIVDMSKKICEQEGYTSAFGQKNSDSFLKSLGVEVGDDGKMKIFAELEKTIASRQDGADKKNAVKRTTVEAFSVEELLQKIRSVDWNSIKADRNTTGGRFDYSV